MSTSNSRLFVITLLVLAVHICGGIIGGYYTWGVGIWHVLPLWFLLTASVIVIVPFFVKLKSEVRTDRLAGKLFIDNRFPPIYQRRRAALIIVSWLIVGTAILYLLRSRSLLYGDGYAAVASTLHFWSESYSSIHEWLKPLSIALYKATYDFLHILGIVDPVISFAICSSVGGAIGWLGIVRLVKSVEHDSHRRLFLLVAVSTSGAALLFCGHIEFYVWAGASFIWFLALSNENRQRGSLILLGLLTVLFNVILLPAVAAILALCLSKKSSSKWRILLKPGPLVLGSIAASIILAFCLQWFSLSYGTVPVIPHARSQYWLLSFDHLSDVANAILFACPLIFILMWPSTVLSTAKAHSNLMVASILVWLVSFWIDTDAGAVRDWDLLSLYGIPMTLFCSLAIVERTERAKLSTMLIPLFLLALFLNVPYLYEKVNRPNTVERLNAIIMDDPHYQTSYMNGQRAISWSALLYNEEGRGDLATAFLYRRIQADSISALAYANLGSIYLETERYDSAEVYLQAALNRDSGNDIYRVQLSNALLFQSKWENLAPLLLQHPSDDSVYVSVLHQCGKGLFAQGKLEEALACFHRLDTLRTRSIYYKLSIAMSYARLDNTKESLDYFAQAAELCPDSGLCQLYSVSLGDLINSRSYSVARRLLRYYLDVCPVTDTSLVNQISEN